MFERARTAVPHLSAPIFIWTVFLRIVFKVVCDTSCSKAKSISCRRRKYSSMLDDIALMLSVAILNVWNIIGIMRVGSTRTAKLIDSVRLCSAFYYASFILIRASPCLSSVFCCALGLIGGGGASFPSHSLETSPCVFACRGRTVCLVGLSSNAVISASTDITSWGTVQVVMS